MVWYGDAIFPGKCATSYATFYFLNEKNTECGIYCHTTLILTLIECGTYSLLHQKAPSNLGKFSFQQSFLLGLGRIAALMWSYTHTHTHTQRGRERERERESVCVRERESERETVRARASRGEGVEVEPNRARE